VPVPLFSSTNYDALIERAIGQWISEEVAFTTGFDPRLGNILASPPTGSLFFVKVHGSISGSEIVLTTEEYDRAYLSTSRISTFLTALMLRYFVVFVGCSLEDEVVRLRRKLVVDFEGLIPTAYALLPDTEQNRVRRGWLRDVAQIESITYPEGDANHSSVTYFLEQAGHSADLLADHGRMTGLTRTDFLGMPIQERLAGIGTVNEELLRIVCDSSDNRISHTDLVELSRYDSDSGGMSISKISPEERVYRMQFLVSIGLVEELKEDTLKYILPGDVLSVVNSEGNEVK